MLQLKKNKIEGLIIDLRSNSGGLLSNSINILDKLTERGVNLLNTRGRIPKSNREMNSRRAPMVSNEIPIAENENFIFTCPKMNIFLKNGKSQNIFTFSLL